MYSIYLHNKSFYGKDSVFSLFSLLTLFSFLLSIFLLLLTFFFLTVKSTITLAINASNALSYNKQNNSGANNAN